LVSKVKEAASQLSEYADFLRALLFHSSILHKAGKVYGNTAITEIVAIQLYILELLAFIEYVLIFNVIIKGSFNSKNFLEIVHDDIHPV
jgi:hypothetical protein